MAAASNEPLCLARMVLAVVVVFGLACGRSMLSLPDSASSGAGGGADAESRTSGHGGTNVTLPVSSTGGAGGAANSPTPVGCASAGIALPDDGGVSAVCPCTVSVESPAGNWVDDDPTGTPCSLVGAACHYLGWGSSGCGLTDCACMASEYGFHWACWGPLCY